MDVAVVTETHFKRKHSDSVVSINGYTLYRRDRLRRRGGGVADWLCMLGLLFSRRCGRIPLMIVSTSYSGSG